MAKLTATPCGCAEYRRLNEACADLMRERDALRKDAERYRWLREKSTDESGDIELRIWIGGEDGDWEWPTIPDEVDAAIDAAMQEAPNA